MLVWFLLAAGPVRPSPSTGTWHAPINSYELAVNLSFLFIPLMYVMFALGCERIAKWIESRDA